MAQNNRQITRRMESLRRRIDEHKGYIEREPNSRACRHWRREIKACEDFHDLIEICGWFLQFMNSASRKQLSRDEVESFLIELDVNLVDHGGFHLKSLKKGITATLKQISDDEGRADNVSGAA